MDGKDSLQREEAGSSSGPKEAGRAVETQQQQEQQQEQAPPTPTHDSLKYSLLGPSLLKAGQESVDQSKVSEIIYNASKGSKFFVREEAKDRLLSAKIDRLRATKAALERQDLAHERRLVDARLRQLQDASSASSDLSQIIVHVDCDAFYAAVEVLDRPELADVPFAVGGDGSGDGSGVLSTCNYAARKFGCRSGMAAFVARKLCPALVLLRPDFAKYTAKAREVRAVLARYDPRFESASIDEAYLNITEYVARHGGQDPDPERVVHQLRREIAEQTHITVSAGIAANTRLAKICSNINKPNGQFALPRDRPAILAFMHRLPCRSVNGIGRVLERELASVGIRTCGDIYAERALLRRLFGAKTCDFLLHCYLGLGRTTVQPAAEAYERKSVGTESTFTPALALNPALALGPTTSPASPPQLHQKLRATAEELEKDLARAQCKGRTLVLKIKLHTFEVYTRQAVMPRPICRADDLYHHSLPMLLKLQKELPNMSVRLLGLRCTHLVSTKKPDTLAFFGLGTLQRPASAGERYDGHDRLSDPESEWEVWPDGEPGDEKNLQDKNAVLGAESPAVPSSSTDDVVEPLRNHQDRREVEANTQSSSILAMQRDVFWPCPICTRPQPADERLLNDHIDSCLSRQAILEAVQQSTREDHTSNPTHKSPEKKPATTAPERKRGRPSDISRDPRQKKLCFSRNDASTAQ